MFYNDEYKKFIADVPVQSKQDAININQQISELQKEIKKLESQRHDLVLKTIDVMRLKIGDPKTSNQCAAIEIYLDAINEENK